MKENIEAKKKLGLRIKKMQKKLEHRNMLKRKLRLLYLNENKIRSKLYAEVLKKLRKPKCKVFRLYLEPRNKFKGYCIEFRSLGKTKTLGGEVFILIDLKLNQKWACDMDLFFEDLIRK